jgi:hypothetical protein
MSWELIALLVVAALPALIVFQALVAKWEKRMVWPYGELQSQPHFGDPSGYGTGCLQEAAQSGWQFLGWAPDLKGEMYRVSYAMLLAPEGDGLAIIGVGQVLNFQVAGTWLHSLARDDPRSWFSTDQQACLETDLSGLWTGRLVHVNSFGELWQRHRTWVGSLGVPLLAFAPPAAVQQFRRYREARCDELARRGLIAYTDPQQIHWRYTWGGALKVAVRSLLRGFSPK